MHSAPCASVQPGHRASVRWDLPSRVGQSLKALLHLENEMDVKAETAAAIEYIQKLPGLVEFAMVGSALYMPETAVADVDFAVLVAPEFAVAQYTQELMADSTGWESCSEYATVGGMTMQWTAIRRGNLNLMLSNERKFFDGYKLAMEVCKALKLQTRAERITVCRVVRDGFTAEMLEEPVYRATDDSGELDEIKF